MIELFIALSIGFVFQKRRIFTPQTNRRISDLIVTVTSPALILSSVSSSSGTGRAETTGLLIAGFLIYICIPVLAFLAARLFKIRKEIRGTFQALLIFGNTGFMGIPVVMALYGKEAVFPASILHLPFNLLVFTYGVHLLSGYAEEESLTIRQKIKQIMNPGLFASLAALVIYFTGITIPDIVMTPVSFIGDITPALSMIVLGSILGEYPTDSLFREKSIWLVCLFRLCLIPLLIWSICLHFFNNPMLSGIILLTNAMPGAAMCAMLSAKYHGNEQYAAVGVFITTILSLITIPVFSALFLI